VHRAQILACAIQEDPPGLLERGGVAEHGAAAVEHRESLLVGTQAEVPRHIDIDGAADQAEGLDGAARDSSVASLRKASTRRIRCIQSL
jgi:hypothetical protein